MSMYVSQDIIDNCNYLTALNDDEAQVSTEILDTLLPPDHPQVRAVEERLRAKGGLAFDTIFEEAAGFYLLRRFLASLVNAEGAPGLPHGPLSLPGSSGKRKGKAKARGRRANSAASRAALAKAQESGGVDALLFLKDAKAYRAMKFEPARLKVARMIYDRYLTAEGFGQHESVFEAMLQRSDLDKAAGGQLVSSLPSSTTGAGGHSRSNSPQNQGAAPKKRRGGGGEDGRAGKNRMVVEPLPIAETRGEAGYDDAPLRAQTPRAHLDLASPSADLLDALHEAEKKMQAASARPSRTRTRAHRDELVDDEDDDNSQHSSGADENRRGAAGSYDVRRSGRSGRSGRNDNSVSSSGRRKGRRSRSSRRVPRQGSGGRRATSRSRNTTNVIEDDDDYYYEDEMEAPPPPPAGSRSKGGMSRSASARNTTSAGRRGKRPGPGGLRRSATGTQRSASPVKRAGSSRRKTGSKPRAGSARGKKKNKRKANSSSKLGLRGGGMGGAKRKKKGKSDSETSVSDSRRSGSSGSKGKKKKKGSKRDVGASAGRRGGNSRGSGGSGGAGGESERAPNVLNLSGQMVRDIAIHIQQESAPKHLFISLVRAVHKRLVDTHFEDFIASEYYHMYLRVKHMEEGHVGPDEFVALRVLGRGGFGTVYACRKLDSGKLYAMKSIRKKLIKYKKAVGMTMLERHTLSLVDSPFVCSLSYAFQDRKFLYLVMDLMTGGDLKYHLTRPTTVSVGFPERRARFHAAEVLLGLEAMHAKNIIFRDLKLENVLLDSRGHCKISDLGLVAMYGKKKITHYAGTPGYIAPEVAKKQPYGPAVDIFSFGVTLYRMLTGRKPFRGHSRQDFDKAVCTMEPIYDTSVLSPSAISLIKGCLEKDPRRRLGCGKEGIQAIKDHPFFAEIDWGLLEVGYLHPPFVPNKHEFNANPVNEVKHDAADSQKYDKVHLDDKFKRQIHGFDYVSPHAVQTEVVAALRTQAKIDTEAQAGAKGAATNSCCVIL